MFTSLVARRAGESCRAEAESRAGESYRADLAVRVCESNEVIDFFLSHSWHDDGSASTAGQNWQSELTSMPGSFGFTSWRVLPGRSSISRWRVVPSRLGVRVCESNEVVEFFLSHSWQDEESANPTEPAAPGLRRVIWAWDLSYVVSCSILTLVTSDN